MLKFFSSSKIVMEWIINSLLSIWGGLSSVMDMYFCNQLPSLAIHLILSNRVTVCSLNMDYHFDLFCLQPLTSLKIPSQVTLLATILYVSFSQIFHESSHCLLILTNLFPTKIFYILINALQCSRNILNIISKYMLCI